VGLEVLTEVTYGMLRRVEW